ncbi:MAG: type II secretion system F family protein, partial [Acetanaerobacterium sp.]
TYRYEAQSTAGAVVRGLTEADNPGELFSKLKQRGEYCITFSETRADKLAMEKSIGTPKISTRELALVCRQFSTMLNAGLTVIKCLDTLYRQAVKRGTRAAMMGVYEGVQKGLALSVAMKQQGVFPMLLINMVESGEMSGSLDTIMMRMAEHFEKEHKLKSKVTNAMIYPIALVIAGIGVMGVLLGFVIPQFFTMFDSMGAELPAITKFLLSLSTFVREKWLMILIAAAGAVVLMIMLWKSRQGRRVISGILLKLPFFGKLQKTIITARFSRSLATLYSSGMSLITALEISTRVVGNAMLDWYMEDGIEQVRKGVALSAVIGKITVFPPMFASMVSVGEESGALDDILYKNAAFYDDESDAAISAMVASIEPIMIVVLGVVVGFIVLSVIMPMMSVYQAVAGL